MSRLSRGTSARHRHFGAGHPNHQNGARVSRFEQLRPNLVYPESVIASWPLGWGPAGYNVESDGKEPCPERSIPRCPHFLSKTTEIWLAVQTTATTVATPKMGANYYECAVTDAIALYESDSHLLVMSKQRAHLFELNARRGGAGGGGGGGWGDPPPD